MRSCDFERGLNSCQVWGLEGFLSCSPIVSYGRASNFERSICSRRRGEVSRFHPLAESAEAILRGLKVAHQLHVGSGRHLQIESPINAVHEQAAQTFIAQIGRAAHGGAENPIGLAGFIAVKPIPCERLVRIVFGRVERGVRSCSRKDFRAQEKG